MHEGPVLANLPLEALSRVRADFIESMGWGRADDVHREFALREARLDVSRGDHEVVLWFEHDLYDQLQLIEVLAWYARSPVSALMLAHGRDAWEMFAASDPQRAARRPDAVFRGVIRVERVRRSGAGG
ncbi:MAG: hypothetical protein ABIU95_11990 [Burkholderiales bacterium]